MIRGRSAAPRRTAGGPGPPARTTAARAPGPSSPPRLPPSSLPPRLSRQVVRITTQPSNLPSRAPPQGKDYKFEDYRAMSDARRAAILAECPEGEDEEKFLERTYWRVSTGRAEAASCPSLSASSPPLPGYLLRKGRCCFLRCDALRVPVSPLRRR